ncbi:AAA family ATPase [Pseudomonas sp. PIC25]|uniref:RNA-binding domain-containing protein n=1 Tax=Pseudomonas sp. PIC25 TaxID=1958773 RepID=UPI000BD09D04|nr:RNA-binding domain-containing protein [Pseudomonas sp. PIC25]PAU60681.1 AAA family ATPase [Pseudomonas sp. PIC25]
MIQPYSLDDLSLLVETVELECKLAQGQDGKGEVPKDFWATYSAFANTHGGVVLLGVREKDGQFSVAGLSNVEKVRTDLFNTLNNPAKVSINLLTDDDVVIRELEGKRILEVRIPAASRKQKPVFLNGQPLGNTYRRLHEGDRRCDEESVKRMFAEQVEDSRDERILPHYDLSDIDPDSLRIYRQMLSDRKANHPALEHQGVDFLRQIGGWRRDRATGQEGLTVAGLLMFGRWLSIQEAMPHYFLDYQERPQAKTELRWIDRLVPDGTWSGNLFDFYRRVYRKLTEDLKVPFALKGDQRQDNTPVHEALREALVNTLVHADYTGRVSVLVVKRPDLFGFRNPGGLRLPLEQVLQGGTSDCRNRLMHQMFLMIGLGERGGSGVPKIYSGWRSQHWRPPALYEKDEPEQTLLELRMVDLLPAEAVEQLRERFGERFDRLDHTARMILATAAIERVVNHNRLLELCDAHPHDLSQMLSRLVKEGMLVSDGRSRGMMYHLPGEVMPTPEQVFEGPQPMPGYVSPTGLGLSSEHWSSSSEHFVVSSEHWNRSSEHFAVSSEHWNSSSEDGDSNRDEVGRWVSPHLPLPVVDSLDCLDENFRTRLETMAAEPRRKKKLARERMQQVLTALCREQFMTLNVLARLVERNPDALRQQYLNEMVRHRQIQLAFPSRPTHERQAYRASQDEASVVDE